MRCLHRLAPLTALLALGACSPEATLPGSALPTATAPFPTDESDETELERQAARTPTPEGNRRPASRLELARHYAPVWYQDSDSRAYESDYIVAYDFDGDRRSDNNWDNLTRSGANLGAVIYYAVVETETHWFITYADFHPRDWDKDCSPWLGLKPSPCHENDMEGAMVVVRKDGSRLGAFEVLYTEAHNTLHLYTNDTTIKAGSTRHLEAVRVTFEGGSHPELYVESKGHGVCALHHEADEHCKHPTEGSPPAFPGGDGLVFRYKGRREVPASGDDRDVGYALVPISTTIWAQRDDVCDSGCTYDGAFDYRGMRVPKAFDGDSYGDDKANPPWGWDDPKDGAVLRGDFFFDPAKMLATHLKLEKPVSTRYLYNPFLPTP